MPELILMDIDLPGMSGYGALTLLRADPATAPIPVIAISVNAMVGDPERAQRAGFHCYLTKPIKLAEFVAAVLAVLGLTR